MKRGEEEGNEREKRRRGERNRKGGEGTRREGRGEQEEGREEYERGREGKNGEEDKREEEGSGEGKRVERKARNGFSNVFSVMYFMCYNMYLIPTNLESDTVQGLLDS